MEKVVAKPARNGSRPKHASLGDCKSADEKRTRTFLGFQQPSVDCCLGCLVLGSRLPRHQGFLGLSAAAH